jgi:DNA-binding GntR family transcriptional regulator
VPPWDPRLYARIANALRQEILNGELDDGQPLNIGELTRRFSCSRDTVQSALRILESEGLIARFKGLGWFVVPREERGRKMTPADNLFGLLVHGHEKTVRTRKPQPAP